VSSTFTTPSVIVYTNVVLLPENRLLDPKVKSALVSPFFIEGYFEAALIIPQIIW
jgi:hypothetical protein